MNREDIIPMAIEAELNLYINDLTEKQYIEVIERFAALVASAERERIKQANVPEIERINAHIKQLEDAVKAEREACAKVCEQHGYEHYCGNVTDKLAETIRARGQA